MAYYLLKKFLESSITSFLNPFRRSLGRSCFEIVGQANLAAIRDKSGCEMCEERVQSFELATSVVVRERVMSVVPALTKRPERDVKIFSRLDVSVVQDIYVVNIQKSS